MVKTISVYYLSIAARMSVPDTYKWMDKGGFEHSNGIVRFENVHFMLEVGLTSEPEIDSARQYLESRASESPNWMLSNE